MKITKREKEVLIKLSEGLTVKEVASQLYVAPSTVTTHKKNLYQKMEARTLVQLGAKAVRCGIIALFAFVVNFPCIAQSQLEIDGTIKASGLAGTGERMIMADENGQLKVGQQDAAVFEIKDSTGDVRFRFDANQGLFQMLLEGDTISESQTIKIPVEESLSIKNKFQFELKDLTGQSAADFTERVRNRIDELDDKLSLLGVFVSHDNTNPEKVYFTNKNGEKTFSYGYLDGDIDDTDSRNYSITIGDDDKIQSIHYDQFSRQGQSEFTLIFKDGKLLNVEYFYKPDLQIGQKIKAKFDEDCNVIQIEKSSEESEVEYIKADQSASTFIDGQNIISQKKGETSNGEKAWTCTDDNGNPSVGAEDSNNQTAVGKNFVQIFRQDQNETKVAFVNADGIQSSFVDGQNSKFVQIELKPEEDKIIICGNVEVKGNITATGGISENTPMFTSDINKKWTGTQSYHELRGNVTTDNRGKALIRLDSRLSVENYAFSYQLTTIGSFAKAIISEEVENGVFEIATDAPFVKVSWVVTIVPQKLKYENSEKPIAQQPKRRYERIKVN